MKGESVLTAIKLDDTDMLALALQEEGLDINEPVDDDATPLFIAIFWRKANCLRYLLENGADPNYVRDGFTPLMSAAQENYADIVSILAEKAVLDYQGMHGLTALMCAARDGHNDVVKILIDQGASLDIKTDKGTNALMMAKHFSHNETIQLLEKRTVKKEKPNYSRVISELANNLWDICPEPVADSMEEAKKWQSDYFLHFNEFMKYVKPLPQNFVPMVDDAIEAWRHIETGLLARLGNISQEEFMNNFHLIRTAAITDKQYHSLVAEYGNTCYQVVWNILWIYAFAWMLPAADPTKKERYHSIARVMIAVMYLEILWKDQFEYLTERPDILNESYRKMEALYRIVFE